MSTAPLSPPAAHGRSLPSPGRRVTDAPTRMFHALFALSFVGAYLTAEGERWRAMHVTLGYAMAGLLAFRVLYGLFGPPQARLAALARRLSSLPAWLCTVARALPRRTVEGVSGRQGQNLAMALAVALLLATTLPLVLTGYGAAHDWGDRLGGEAWADLHAGLGEAMLAIGLCHVALLAGLSALRRRNQALPMLTGRVDGTGPDLVRHDRAALAACLLVAVIAFVAWEWQQSPHGLVPTSAVSTRTIERLFDDD